MSGIVNEVKSTWPYFAPAWLHAMLLPKVIEIVLVLSAFCRDRENCLALLYHMSFSVWLLALIPIRKRLVTVEHAIVFILLPYLPYVAYLIISMRD